ncbi:MAG: T9SS type A sorting domain-containing protein [Flavobacteriales bacterium]
MNNLRTVHAALLAFTTLSAPQAVAQSRSNLWLGGFEDQSPPPWGGVDLGFTSESLSVAPATRVIDFFRTNANITDSEGNLQFSTNGAFLGNALGDTLLNGTGLNPSNYTNLYPEGLHGSQYALILPEPESSTVYHLIHCAADRQAPYIHALQLYRTTVDMSHANGLGAAVVKNEVVFSDTLVAGKITAVRHANGRDWWVLCHRHASDIYYRLLVTPEGVSAPEQQPIGVVRRYTAGQACFSLQGDKFAYYFGISGEDLEIFDFDRCTGLLSNPVHVPIDDLNNHGGVAFSPSGRYLYVSSIDMVYQFDTWASDIAGSRVTIAVWDGFYSPSPPFATMFDIAQLAPDGKIYIGTGNGTLHLHVINEPDNSGLACGMVQHGVELPRYFMNSLPNHPNYHLGPIDGSICDSLGIDSHVPEAELAAALRAYPNPSTGAFSLSYAAQPIAGELVLYNAAGQVVLRERLPAWSTVHNVALLGAAPGMYHAQLRWGAQRVGTRVILTEP